MVCTKEEHAKRKKKSLQVSWNKSADSEFCLEEHQRKFETFRGMAQLHFFWFSTDPGVPSGPSLCPCPRGAGRPTEGCVGGAAGVARGSEAVPQGAA